jgi:hypothetical protein
MNDRLRLAMAAADSEPDETTRTVDAVGLEAVSLALASPAEVRKDEPRKDEVDRQRDLDAALADAVEAVARQRARLGRRVCSRHDGEAVRKIFEVLRALQPGADSDVFA